ncbi:hypothetical protein M378DRAFT_396671 [Amanita muscaria Koide BX008]|uniref:Uncharacterized protein n=1 Tax=Amanita muscaria (strain Koide BX008) TaxID=946122 RepID=A0A0C2W818_AMAMK|nr:hypothetical protein M378DRAFT_396671 [Amanita muscaria Koide BX008]
MVQVMVWGRSSHEALKQCHTTEGLDCHAVTGASYVETPPVLPLLTLPCASLILWTLSLVMLLTRSVTYNLTTPRG